MMYSNYFKIVIRNIIRQKLYTLINVIGLSLGLALFVLILLYVQFEFNYDKFNKNYKNIYRVEEDYGGRGQLLAITNNPIGPSLLEDYPEVINQTRLRRTGNRMILDAGNDKKYFENNGWWAENSFFDIFTYRFVNGNPNTALKESNSIVLTESTAQKYFPYENPVGKTIKINNEYSCKVTAVLENPPNNSHIFFHYLISFNTYEKEIVTGYLNNWNVLGVYTYILTNENIKPAQFNSKVNDLLRRKQSEEITSNVYIKPLSELHLYSNVLGELGPRGNIETIIIYSSIGLFILLIASINFMNLSTARSIKRAKEVGVRKVSGARRIDLIIQFLSESVLLSLLSMILAVLIIVAVLAEFNSIVQRELTFEITGFPNLLTGLFLIAVLVGIISGSYPAFFLSGFNPVKVLKSSFKIKSRNFSERDFLVVFQFAISVFLITGTIIIKNQLSYLREKDVGYDKAGIITLSYTNIDSLTSSKYKVFKDDLLKMPDVKSVSISRFAPHFNGASIRTGYEGAPEGETIYTNINNIDEHFLDTYRIKLKIGKNIKNTETYTDSIFDVLINDTFFNEANWDNPIGKRIGQFRVVGIINDYNFTSLKESVLPLILFPLNPSGPRMINSELTFTIRLNTPNREKTIDKIKSRFLAHFPNDIFEPSNFSEEFEFLLREEDRTAKTAGYFSIMAIFISCLGLFGLSSFVSEQKRKEIGIRKVLGSSVLNIIFLLAKNFTKLILIANIIVWPLIYFIMRSWLEDFAYRIDIDISTFILAAIISLTIGIVSVSFQTIKAAFANPVESIKYE